MAIISLKNSSLFNTAKGFAFQKTTGAVPILPTPTFTSATTSSYTVSITGYDAQFTYTVSASAGSAVRTGGNVTVSGLSANQSSTLTVTAANTARELSFSSAVAFLSLPATPTLSRSDGTTTTVTVTIGNYDAGLTYTIGSSVGSATRSGNTITVTGLTEGQAVTVIATASNASGSSTQGSLATGAVPSTPTLSFASATTTSLTFTITNYNAAYSYSVSASAGSASRSGNTITVTGLSSATTYTAFATSTANGVSSAQGSASGSTTRSKVLLSGYDTGYLARSINGSTWTQITPDNRTNSMFNGVSGNGSGTWIALKGTDCWVSTNDAISFTKFTAPTNGLYTTKYVNGSFIASQYTTNFFTSTNGTTWTQRSLGTFSPSTYVYSVGSGNGTGSPCSEVIINGWGGSSSDSIALWNGSSVSVHSSPTFRPYGSVGWNSSAGKRYVVSSAGTPNVMSIFYSSSISGPWTNRTLTIGNSYNTQIYAFAATSSRIVMVGGDDVRATTTATDLTGLANYGGPNAQAFLNDVVYADTLGLYVGAGIGTYSDSGLITSGDGVNWGAAQDPLGTSAYRPIEFA